MIAPRAVSEASGMLNVCVDPTEDIPKSSPAVPVAKVCTAPDIPLIDTSPAPSTSIILPAASSASTLPLAVLVADEELRVANLIPEAEPLFPEKVEVALKLLVLPTYRLLEMLSLVVLALLK